MNGVLFVLAFIALLGCSGLFSTPKYLSENATVSKSEALHYCKSKVEECTDVPTLVTAYKSGCDITYQNTGENAGTKKLIGYANSLCKE
ncbi:hypothetical protein AUJ17_05505 [Candidatus Micrarchaeota archaeon CG1_02_47_40]|nr:MAG: hypothetical protein AUJ17_05505 [Candidatus Micrarchaeota archaeon CG1_02_47_40]